MVLRCARASLARAPLLPMVLRYYLLLRECLFDSAIQLFLDITSSVVTAMDYCPECRMVSIPIWNSELQTSFYSFLVLNHINNYVMVCNLSQVISCVHFGRS